MEPIVTAIYSIVADLFKANGHPEDCRRHLRDAEVITATLVAARFFGGNQLQACQYLQETGLMPRMLEKSRFNRRLHQVAELIYQLQHQLGQMWIQLSSNSEYVLDSFPVEVCENARIQRCHLLRGKEYRGYSAAKKRFFYGIRIHLLSTTEGIPVEWVFLPGSAHDLRGLKTLPLNLPQGSIIYEDKAFNDYEGFLLKVSCFIASYTLERAFV